MLGKELDVLYLIETMRMLKCQVKLLSESLTISETKLKFSDPKGIIDLDQVTEDDEDDEVETSNLNNLISNI